MATERIRTLTTGTSHRSANKAVGTRTRIKAVRRRRLLLIAVLCAVVWPMLAWVGAKLLIVKSDLAFAEGADAIVVFSGSSTYIERADWAARLYLERRAPVVVLTDDKLLSGWNAAEERNPYFYELSAKELQKRGVPAERIRVVSEAALGTYDESVNECQFATSHQLKKLLIVTSAYHSRRALWSMRHACAGTGIETGVNGPPPGWQTPAPSLWWLRRWGWRVVAGEYAKMIYYWWRY
jgi:uncharacterized SAM-binding protein YcdF (DUF218 family)